SVFKSLAVTHVEILTSSVLRGHARSSGECT
ncbi:hypothetical protein CSUI_002577, partial [Cystoisospora suis]